MVLVSSCFFGPPPAVSQGLGCILISKLQPGLRAELESKMVGAENLMYLKVSFQPRNKGTFLFQPRPWSSPAEYPLKKSNAIRGILRATACWSFAASESSLCTEDTGQTSQMLC